MRKIKLLNPGIFSMIALFSFILVTSCSDDDSGNGNNDMEELATIEGVAFDAITFDKMEGATVTLVPMENSEKTLTNISEDGNEITVVDNNGNYKFENVVKGVYSLVINQNGYNDMLADSVDLNQGNPFVAFLPVADSITTPVGGITGVVLDGNMPVSNANISISAQNESLTNGYFSSTTTNSAGQFFIGAVPLQTTQTFKVRCIAESYETNIISNVNINQNQMKVLYFSLSEAEPAQSVLSEDFESDVSNWTMTGFWHIQQNANITNVAYPDYVKLAPNDNSEGKIPSAYEGSYMAWYGADSSGNFMGAQSYWDDTLSGGTSEVENEGDLISPAIDLSGYNEASLNFWSWFEIESVNPNQYGFDLMEVYVEAGGSETLIGKLNPYTDPIIADREALPFTSGGFNKAPVWKYEEFDLSNYTGQTIKLIFRFQTRDELYNGFRGWFVDDINIVDKAVVTEKAVIDPDKPLMKRN